MKEDELRLVRKAKSARMFLQICPEKKEKQDNGKIFNPKGEILTSDQKKAEELNSYFALSLFTYKGIDDLSSTDWGKLKPRRVQVSKEMIKDLQ